MFNSKFIIIFFTVIGASIGGYYHIKTGNYILTGLGAVFGSIAGRSIAKIFNNAKTQTNDNLLNINTRIVGSAIFTLLGFIAYAFRHNILVLLSTLYFLIGTISLIIKKYKSTEHRPPSAGCSFSPTHRPPLPLKTGPTLPPPNS